MRIKYRYVKLASRLILKIKYVFILPVFLIKKRPLITLFLVILFFALYLLYCSVSLPSLEKVFNYKPYLISKFYDANDELIYEYGTEKRTHININQVPKMLVYAFISAEDKTFYTNPGFDIDSLTKTFVRDVIKVVRGRRLNGGSTITQQVVKNILLSNERTISRKIKEIILSYRLSKILSKDTIMEIYLNHIYLGMQAYGIVSASDEYFGKSVSQLTVPEMALLAGMPKAPSVINPFRNYNRAIERRNWVLSRMMENGYITQDQYEQYSKTELVVKKKQNDHYPFYAPSFFAKSLLSSKEIGITKDSLLQDGYKVKLTIDGELQRIAQKALNNSLEDYSKKHGYTGPIMMFNEGEVKDKTPSELLRGVDEPENLNRFNLAVVIEVQDDKVKIGLRDNSFGFILLDDLQWARQKISETEISEKKITKCSDVLNVGDVIVVDKKSDDSNYYSLEQLPQINGSVLAINPKTGEVLAMVGGYADLAGAFNRSVQAFRQVGSTIKPFVYGVALENGFSPTSIFMDTDISINIGDGVTWNPANDNRKTNGPTTLRIGLEKSKNTVTIRIADIVGLRKIRQKIIDSGLNKNPENNLSIALGAVESSPMDVAVAYSAFANNGLIVLPYLISYVKNVSIGNAERTTTEDLGNGNIFNKIYFNNCDVNARCDIFFNKNDNNNDDKNEVYDQDLQEVKDTNNNDFNEDEKINELFKPDVAFQVASILQGAVKNGTSKGLNSIGLPIASKTGTSNDGKDLWNVVMSPEIILVAYVGYDIPVETNNYGSQFALSINREILANLPKKYIISDFKTPENIKFVKINRLTGKLATDNDKYDDIIFEAFKDGDEIPVNNKNNNDVENNDIDFPELL